MISIPRITDHFPKRSHDAVVTDKDDVRSVAAYRAELLEALANEKTLDRYADERGYVIDNDGMIGGIRYMKQTNHGKSQNGIEKHSAGDPGDDVLGTYKVFMGNHIKGIDTDEITDVKDKPIGEFMI